MRVENNQIVGACDNQTVGRVVDLLTSREERSKDTISQITFVRNKLNELEQKALEEKNVPLAVASSVLSAGLKTKNDDAVRFACGLISHLNNGEPISSFLGKNPNFANLDLTQIVNNDEEIVNILGPVNDLTLFQLMEGNSSTNEVKAKRKYTKRKDIKILPDKKEEVVEAEVVKENKTTIETVCELYPVVKALFEETENGLWKVREGKVSISSKRLLELFDNVNPSGDIDKDHLSISQSVLSSSSSLMNRFFKKNTNHRPEEIIKMNGAKMNYYPKELVEDFLIFATDFLSSTEGRVVKIKEGEVTQTLEDSKKKS